MIGTGDPQRSPADDRHRTAAREPFREEAALPVRAESGDPDPLEERRRGINVAAFALALTLVVSLALEFAGWRIALDAPGVTGGIDEVEFIRGALDTMLGAVGVGGLGALATLASPTTWRRPWRRIAVGFLGGAAGFLAFLSALTLPYFF